MLIKIPIRFISYNRVVIPLAHQNFDLLTPTKKPPNQSRHISSSLLQDTIKIQSGLFKTLSECTVVDILQTGLVQIHTFTGLPWWMTIIFGTVALRTAFTLPLTIYQHYVIAKLEHLSVEMKSIIQELKRETTMAVRLYKWDEKTAQYQFKRSAKKQWQTLIIRDNCHPVKAALVPWIQVPLWVCVSVTLRNLVYQLPTPTAQTHATLVELSAGGLWWIENLTMPDMTWTLPLVLGLTNLAIIEIQLAVRKTEQSQLHMLATNLFRGLSVVMVPIAACVPSCVALYWVTSSVYGLAQNLILLSPRLRRFCAIPQTSSELNTPYNFIYARLRNKYTITLSQKST